MPRYLISFDAHAMEHIPASEMPEVANAAHAVASEAMRAGAWVFGGGIQSEKAMIVAIDGSISEGSFPGALGGFCIVQTGSRDDALRWAAKFAAACRCPQEVREFMPDPAVGN